MRGRETQSEWIRRMSRVGRSHALCGVRIREADLGGIEPLGKQRAGSGLMDMIHAIGSSRRCQMIVVDHTSPM